MAIDVVATLIGVVVGVVIMSPVLWIAGRLLVGSAKAKFTDAVVIVALGSLAGAIVNAFLSGWIGTLIQLIVYLVLIQKYYECGWGKSIAVAIVTVVIFIIIVFILGIVGVGIFGNMIPTTYLSLFLR
jgi:hypothetical protein